ncbi:hypothetical protein PO909_019510, partial [Leuciscus waleckii]
CPLSKTCHVCQHRSNATTPRQQRHRKPKALPSVAAASTSGDTGSSRRGQTFFSFFHSKKPEEEKRDKMPTVPCRLTRRKALNMHHAALIRTQLRYEEAEPQATETLLKRHLPDVICHKEKAEISQFVVNIRFRLTHTKTSEQLKGEFIQNENFCNYFTHS